MTDEMILEIPVDAAYAVTARLFVATAAREMGLPDGTVEDLRLAASELVANAVETSAPGPIRLTVLREGSDVILDVVGAGTISDAAPISRRALLETVFGAANIVEDEGTRIHVSRRERSTAGEA